MAAGLDLHGREIKKRRKQPNRYLKDICILAKELIKYLFLIVLRRTKYKKCPLRWFKLDYGLAIVGLVAQFLWCNSLGSWN